MAGPYGDRANVAKRRKARRKAIEAPGNTGVSGDVVNRSEAKPPGVPSGTPEGVPTGRPTGSPNPGFSAKTASGRRRMNNGSS